VPDDRNEVAQPEASTSRVRSFKPDEITSTPVQTVSELIDLHELLKSLSGGRWAFRGQPRDFGTLVPSFPRQFTRHCVGAAEIIEHRLIEAFRKHYEDLPDRSADMPSPEAIGVNYALRCLSVMQHYEIPTRLLDWTSNFWTAIYFACASEPASMAELWCYNRSLFETQRTSRSELFTLIDHSSNPPPEPQFLERRTERIVVELDPQISPRMKTQEAHHTVATDAFADHAPLIFDLQETYPWVGEGAFRRVPISGSCKGNALQFLAQEMNITASTIFPDVVGLGRFLRWQFESLRTMLM
jgi:hypothetical protein